MDRLIKGIALATVAVIPFVVQSASAQTYSYSVDQSASGQSSGGLQTAVGNSTYNNGPVGQSFTPALTQINYVSFMLEDTNGSGNPSVVSVSLYQGTGFSPSRVLLGQSNVVTLTNSSYAPIVFDFGSTIPLTPGSTYSFVFNNLLCGSGQSSCNNDASVLTTGGDTYAGGGAFRSNFQGDDYVFSEGVRTVAAPAAPEPATWSLMILGFGIVGGALRRQKRRALAIA